MKVVKFDKNLEDPKTLQSILAQLSNRRFIAISFDNEGNAQDHWYKVSDQEAVFHLEVLKAKIIEEARS